jgi:O-antigen ligase
MNRFTSFAVFLYSAISLVIPSGYSVGAGLLVLGSLVLLKKRDLTLSRDDLRLMAVFFFYFLVSICMNVLHAESFREYDLPFRFLLAIPALLLLRAYPPAPVFFWSGLAVGAIAAGLFAGWQNLTLHGMRAGGHTNPIQYGNVSSILGILCLVGLDWGRRQRKTVLWTVVLLSGFVMGMLGSMFTGSRGSWVGFPFCLVVLFRCYYTDLGRRYIYAGIASVVVAIAVAYAIPRTELQARTKLAINEGVTYLKIRNAETSIGTRIEMWRAGAMAATERPWLGWGKAGFVAWEAAAIDAGRVHPFMRNNNHVYNEWLDAQVKRGVFGLIALLALYAVPIYMFVAQLKLVGARAKPYAIAGIMIFINYIFFGFSQVILTNNTGVMTLAFSTAILWALLRGEAEKERQGTMTSVA